MKTLIIGIGNRDRGDDAAGCMVADKLRERSLDADILTHDGEPSSLMQAWQGHKRVILVDAMQCNGKMGEIVRLDLHQQTLPHMSQASTHGFGLAEAVELARAMDTLPPMLEFYGIEACTFEPGKALSIRVSEAVKKLVKQISEELTHA